MRAKTVLTLLTLAALGLFCAGAALAEPLGLSDCIALATDSSSGVKLAKYQKEWEQEKLDAAQRRFFPQMDLKFAHEPKTDYFGRPIEDIDTYTSQVKLIQPLYKSGALTLSRDHAQEGLKVAGLLSEKERLDASRKVVPAYYRLLSSRRVHQIRQGLLSQAQELQELAQKGYDLGQLRREELLAASAKRLEVAYEAAQADSESKQAAYELKELLGMPREYVLKVKNQEPDYKTPATADELLYKAQSNNVALQHARASEKYHLLGLQAAEAEEMSRFNLEGAYGLEGDEFPGNDKFYSLMLTWEMNFGDSTAKAFYGREHQYENPWAFYDKERDLQRKGISFSVLDGSSKAIAIAKARMERLRARDDAIDAQDKLRTELLVLWQELKRQRSLMDLAGQQQNLQTERLAVARTRFDTGSAPPAEVLERQLDLADAEAKLIEARSERARILSQMCILSGEELCLKDCR